MANRALIAIQPGQSTGFTMEHSPQETDNPPTSVLPRVQALIIELLRELQKRREVTP
jgi:hypothetical protein